MNKEELKKELYNLFCHAYRLGRKDECNENFPDVGMGPFTNTWESHAAFFKQRIEDLVNGNDVG